MPPRDRASTPRNATKVTVPESVRFLNREIERDQIFAALANAVGSSEDLAVLEVVGPGGAGKSRLLSELRDSALELAPSPKQVVRVALKAEAAGSSAGPLLQIRRAVGVECLLYDTALLTYWQAMGQLDRLNGPTALGNSLAVQAGQALGGAAGVPLPLSFAIDAFFFCKSKLTRAMRYDPEEFEAIDLLRDTPEEIERRLPEFLAFDIQRSFGPGETLFAFYDGYENQKAETLRNRSPWLRTFIRSLDSGVHVIATREPLSWDEEASPGDEVETVTLGPLPEAESRELIEARIGEGLEERIVERMLETSRCLPFFLEAIVDALPSEVRGVRLDALPSPGEDPVGHLLAHLGESEQRLAVALATIQVFDRELFESLVQALHFKVDVFEFDFFVQRFYVEDLPPSLHKTHDILTQFVRERAATQEISQRTLLAATEELPRRCLRNGLDDTEALLPIFTAIMSGWYSVPDPPVGAVESLIDAGYLLYDAGYWKEIGSLPLNEGDDLDHPVAVAAEFFAALSARRTVGVDRSLELFGKLTGRVSDFGRHRRSVALEAAYLKELGGDYPSARCEFVELERRIDRFDATSRQHVRSRLYLADMETMDGELEVGARRLLETYESELLSKADWAELVRHRGHALRFSFLFETATELYQMAMRATTELRMRALEAKLWTNLAEAGCWRDPTLALQAVGNSTELNERLGNRIELAKCEAARAIALAKLERFGEANEAVVAAQRQADRVGYPAGNAFALQAKALSLALAGRDEAADAAFGELERSVDSLGTYAHLTVAPSCLIRTAAEFERRAAEVGWQEPDGVTTRIREYLMD
ncbi:MAG TPA: hypothetical protein VLK37_02930 [Solirubrobacterales bacterium]|nr:hypothetical protein [Solirubrobacterales bacterium]